MLKNKLEVAPDLRLYLAQFETDFEKNMLFKTRSMISPDFYIKFFFYSFNTENN